MAAVTTAAQSHSAEDAMVKVGFSDLKQDGSSFWNHQGSLFSIAAHQSSREYMEDRMFCLCDEKNKFSIFSIFDGHGGDFVSKYLEEHFTTRIRQRLINTDLTKSETIKDAIAEEIYKFDEEMSKTYPQAKEAGSTLTTAIIHNNKIYVAQLGDSRAVACDSNGKCVILTKEHKPSDPKERNRIISAGGTIQTIGVDRVEGVLAVSRAMGDAQFKENQVVSSHPEISEIDLTKDAYHYLILGSDGLFDVIPANDAIEFSNRFLQTHGNEKLSELAHTLCQEALTRKSLDNISVVVVKLVL